MKEDLGESKSKKLKYLDADGKHRGEKVEDMHQAIAKLGDAGWELLFLTEIHSPSGRVYYFKKAK